MPGAESIIVKARKQIYRDADRSLAASLEVVPYAVRLRSCVT